MSLWLIIARVAEILNLPQPSGILVERVVFGSPADHGRLRGGDTQAQIGEQSLLLGGDILLKVGKLPVEDIKSLERIYEHMKQEYSPPVLRLSLYRHGSVMDIMLERE